MTETRLFDVAFGHEGGDQQVLLTGVPVWEARLFAMNALEAEAQRLEARHPDVAERLRKTRQRLQYAELGSIVFGHVEHYDAKMDHTGKNQEMFIALLPTGTDYRDAGQKTIAAAFGQITGRPLFTPSTEAP